MFTKLVNLYCEHVTTVLGKLLRYIPSDRNNIFYTSDVSPDLGDDDPSEGQL